MGARETLRKMLLGSADPMGQTSYIPEPVVQDLLTEGMGSGRPFNPGQPITPLDGFSNTPRSRDYLTGVNISSRPRHNEQVAFSTLKGLVNAYDIAQICIWHRIDSIRSLPWSLVAKPGEGGDVTRAIELATRVLSKPDRETSFHSWVAKYLFDILAFDAGTLYRLRNGAGQAIGLRVVDGTTVAPLIDYWGNRPTGDAPAYVQFAQGVPWEWLRDDDIVYEPFRPRSDSMYGRAPLESILLNANTDLRFQNYFLNRFTEGNVPEGFAGAPEGWTPDQIREYQEIWDTLLYGDDTQKHQIKWVPHGTKFDWSNESEFSDKFSLFLMRKTCAAYHVTPQDLGFTEDVNRASGDTQADVQFRIGDQPLIAHLQGIFTRFVQDDLGLPLEFMFDTGKETEDRVQTAQADKIYIEMGVVGASEIREKRFGLSEQAGQEVPRFIMSNRAGPIPLNSLYSVAGPTDPETNAPLPGAELAQVPFSGVPGVAPEGALHPPALAPNPPAVAKEGMTTAQGTAYGSPLLEEPEEDEVDVTKALDELAAFKRFTRARRKSGKWRDFNFTTLDRKLAQELNRGGATRVAKDSGQVVAAGLLVYALDTHRVLLLQRAADPLDPAAGTWEAPGGCLEPGELPLDGAIREWQEETGWLLPASYIAALHAEPVYWNASNDVYMGYVLQIPVEGEFTLDDFRGRINPDDPDADLVEELRWWSWDELPGIRLRAEFKNDLELVQDAVLASQQVVKSAWEAHPARQLDERLIAHHAPEVQRALRASMNSNQIRNLVAGYLADQEG